MMHLYWQYQPDPKKYLKSVPRKAQTFIAPELITPAKFKNLELIPFYKLHDARYMIYWHQGSRIVPGANKRNGEIPF